MSKRTLLVDDYFNSSSDSEDDCGKEDVDSAASSAPALTEAGASESNKKQKRVPRVDLHAVEGVAEFGEVVEGPEGHGEWRSVPGFSKDKLRVSESGHYQVFRCGNWLLPNLGRQCHNADGSVRFTVGIHYNPYFVHQLICRAFSGPRHQNSTCDHKDQNTSNNCASNLRWATPIEQSQNKRIKMQRMSTSRPIQIRHVDWTESRDWETFPSQLSAAKAHNINVGDLSHVLNGRGHTVKGYIVRWAEDAEPQYSLRAFDDSNLKIQPIDPPPPDAPTVGPSNTDELWKLAPGVDNLRVSTRGRVQTRKGKRWGRMRTPTATAGHAYAEVKYKGRPKGVHILVYLTHVGSIPEGTTIDHIIPERKFDNRLCAIRLATWAEQRLNRAHKPISMRSNSMKRPVRARLNTFDEWERFESVSDASTTLTTRFAPHKFSPGSISSVAYGKRRVCHGWTFEFCD